MMHCVRKTNTPAGFATGGGAQQGDKSLAFEDPRVIPPGLRFGRPPSIGKTVIDRGYLLSGTPERTFLILCLLLRLVSASFGFLAVLGSTCPGLLSTYHSTMR